MESNSNSSSDFKMSDATPTGGTTWWKTAADPAISTITSSRTLPTTTTTLPTSELKTPDKSATTDSNPNPNPNINTEQTTKADFLPVSLDSEKESEQQQDDDEHTSNLCEVCTHLNFRAIFTPREYDPETQTTRAIYRPELTGNGRHPVARWQSRQERRKNEKVAEIRLGLPKIRTVWFDELSLSGDEDEEEEEEYGADAGSKSGLGSENGVDGADARDDVNATATATAHHSDRDGTQNGDAEDRNDSASGSSSTSQIKTAVTAAAEEDHGDDDAELPADVHEKLADMLENLEVNDDEENDHDNNDYDNENDINNDHDSDSDIGSISTWSGTSHFTENERIDLNKQASGNWSYYHGQLYYLGTIWDVRSRRKRCELCNEFWWKMQSNPDVREQFLTKSRVVIKLLELKGRRADASKREVTMLNMLFVYGYKLDDPQTGRWIVRNPLVLNGTHRDVDKKTTLGSPLDELAFRDEFYGEGRWRYEFCNYKLLRTWLEKCERGHVHPTPAVDNMMKIRLIDVKQKCLVEWQGLASQAPRYAALSYVWGPNPQLLTLTQQNFAQALVQGYFQGLPLNKTIRDAFTLASNMRLSYLWIDSLCIIQDSKEDKSEQIPQMHEIYRRACFTAIAALGQDADAGLPGVSRRVGNRFALHVKDMKVQFRGSCKLYTAATLLDIGFTENYIRGCPYLSRAWTFQEGLLSPRVLVFTASQVYWECDRCTWCEDAHWESDTIDFIGLRAIKNSTPTDVWNDRFERKAYDMPGSEEEEPEFSSNNSYAAVVKEYSGRQLTWNSDILNACDGVLASIKEVENCEFLFGLRTKHFSNDLLFNMVRAVPLRFHDVTPFESGFPTWSWTAWKGSVEFANEARNNSFDLVENLVPCDGVRCFMLDTDAQGSKKVRVINELGGWTFKKGYVRSGEGIYDPTDYADDRLRWLKDETIPETEDSAVIPEYEQDIDLAQLHSHPGFSRIVPKFHIIFNTFSTLVVVRLEYDEHNIRMQNVIMAGTKMSRTNGVWGNKDTIQRKVYAIRKIKPQEQAVSHLGHHSSVLEEESSCPCCGKDTTPGALPAGYELGPNIGRLPPLSASWNAREYLKEFPDGLYKLLWMNNNQLPMFGHLLCKPASDTASKDGQWDGEILQRVSGVVGPTDVLTVERQEHYSAEWGTHILG